MLSNNDTGNQRLHSLSQIICFDYENILLQTWSKETLDIKASHCNREQYKYEINRWCCSQQFFGCPHWRSWLKSSWQSCSGAPTRYIDFVGWLNMSAFQQLENHFWDCHPCLNYSGLKQIVCLYNPLHPSYGVVGSQLFSSRSNGTNLSTSRG